MRRSREHLYVVVTVAWLQSNPRVLRQCVQQRPQTLRRNVAGTHVVLKWPASRGRPRELGPVVVYTQDEIRTLLDGVAWRPIGP